MAVGKRIEVEHKYPVSNRAVLKQRLLDLGAVAETIHLQVDRYYAHPARDFAATDEALRIRRIGEQNFVTYKGPKLDATTKTRREIELPLSAHESGAADFAALLDALGFKVVAEVRKERSTLHLDWQGRKVELALDEVQDVGSFIELELVVEESEVPQAKAALAGLAKRLELTGSERRSYLELLLEKKWIK